MTLDPAASTSPRTQRLVTLAEWLTIPEEKRAELIDGRLVYQAMPGPHHGMVQSQLSGVLAQRFNRRAGDAERPGGWWITHEVDLAIGGVGCRPDLLGWRRDKHPRLPVPNELGVVTDAPQWICEVLSRSTAVIDMGSKRSAYHRAGVEWYWLADPLHRTLTVLRRTDVDYLVVLVAGAGESVHPPPFEAAEIDVGEVFDFGDEPGG